MIDPQWERILVIQPSSCSKRALGVAGEYAEAVGYSVVFTCFVGILVKRNINVSHISCIIIIMVLSSHFHNYLVVHCIIMHA